MKMRTALLSLLVILAATIGSATADTIYLKNGTKFDGKLEKQTDSAYYFRIKGLGVQAFPKSSVLKIEKSRSIFDEYAAREAKLSPKDAEGHYELGVWCKKNDMDAEAKKQFRLAIKADPDHAKARDALGYAKYEGKWITKKKKAEILAEIAAEEKKTIEGLALGGKVEDKDSLLAMKAPQSWKKGSEEGALWQFTGPALGKVPVQITLSVDSSSPLDDYQKTVTDEISLLSKGAKVVGKPADFQIAGHTGRILSFEVPQKDGPTLERRDVVAALGGQNIHLSLVCREGYAKRLMPFFTKVAGTLKVVAKPPDVVVKKYGYGYSLPDSSYIEISASRIRTQIGQRLKLPPGARLILNRSNGGVFVAFLAGTKGDGMADASSLSALGKYMAAFMFGGTEKDSTDIQIDGHKGIRGNVDLGPSGQSGFGYFFGVIQGDHYWGCVFMDIHNSMAAEYAKKDFDKLLSSFRIMK